MHDLSTKAFLLRTNMYVLRACETNTVNQHMTHLQCVHGTSSFWTWNQMVWVGLLHQDGLSPCASSGHPTQRTVPCTQCRCGVPSSSEGWWTPQDGPSSYAGSLCWCCGTPCHTWGSGSAFSEGYPCTFPHAAGSPWQHWTSCCRTHSRHLKKKDKALKTLHKYS